MKYITIRKKNDMIGFTDNNYGSDLDYIKNTYGFILMFGKNFTL